jgi:YbgC/YbaW family acyl-CoA thioester hydrolase
MAHKFHTQRKIEFSDTDMAGIVHFSRYFVFMETAEHEFLNSLGTSVISVSNGNKISWPRLSASFDFYAPICFEDIIDIHLLVARKSTKSITYQCIIRKNDQLVARGKMTAVCCTCNSGEPLTAIAIPDTIASSIDEAPAAELDAES